MSKKIKETLKEIFIMILVFFNIISIAYIPSNLIMAVQSKKGIKINSSNREMMSEKILEEYYVKNYRLKGTIEKIEYMQQIGDWALYIYYTDATEEILRFNDGDGYSIRTYIEQNGYDKGKIAFRSLGITILLISFAICYAIKEYRKDKVKC